MLSYPKYSLVMQVVHTCIIQVLVEYNLSRSKAPPLLPEIIQLLTRKYCSLNFRLFTIAYPISMDNFLLLEVDPQRGSDVEGSCIAITIRPPGTGLTRK